jgi:uncharacterized protein
VEPRQVVLDFFAAAARRDKEATKELLAPDVFWNDNGPPEMIGGGSFRDATEVVDYIWGNIRGTRDLIITPQWVVSEGDKVVVLINERATITSTERYYEISSIHVYTVKDGKIAHFINYFDSMPLLRATYDVEFKKPRAREDDRP